MESRDFMENSFKKTPVDTVFKNLEGYIPQTSQKGALAKRINDMYKSGLCKALSELSYKDGASAYIDYVESTSGELEVFEFTVSYNGKRIKFCHVYKGLLPWRLDRAEMQRLADAVKSALIRRKSFDGSFFEDADTLVAKKIRNATVIPKENGYRVIFEKGSLSEKTQIFTVFFKNI